MLLTFLVRNQTIVYMDTKMVPRVGSSNYLQLKFIFATKDWADLRKTLHVSAGEYSEPFILDSDIFNVPTYYTQQQSFTVTLLGDRSDTGVVVPTNVLAISLDASNDLWTAAPPDSENSAYLQLISSIGNLDDLITSAKRNLVAAINEAARSGGSGGMPYELGETLKLTDGVLDVNTSDAPEQDNTLPITSAAVYSTVGNIEALLGTI